MQQLIVGVGYKKGRGKDTFCDVLINHAQRFRPDLKIRKLGFADKLKDVAYQLWGWAGLHPGIYYDERYELKEVILPKIGLSPRELWLGVGNGMREIYGSTWVDYALNGVKGDIILVKDMGFTNEAKAIQEKGGILIKINRPEQPHATDAREVELDDWTDWNHVIENDHNIQALAIRAISIWDVIQP